MAIYTTKIEWRSPYSLADLATQIKNHYSSAGWTLLDDQSSANPRYIVVTKDRGTGFSGDNIIAIINIELYWPGIYMRACDSWDSTAHTGVNVTNAQEHRIEIQNQNCDLWISTDSSFTCMTALNGSTVLNSPIIGVFGLERKLGDNDGGSFYGVWQSIVPGAIRVPSVKTGNLTLATNVNYSVATPLGGIIGLSGIDDSGNDVMFSLTPFISSFGKVKNQIAGIRVCTSNKFANGGDTGSIKVDGYKWMFINQNSSLCFGFPVSGGTTDSAPGYSSSSSSASSEVISPVVTSDASDLTAAIVSYTSGSNTLQAKVWTQTSTGKKIFGTGNTNNLITWTLANTDDSYDVGHVIKSGSNIYVLTEALDDFGYVIDPATLPTKWKLIGPSEGNQAWRLFDSSTSTIYVPSGADSGEMGVNFSNPSSQASFYAQYSDTNWKCGGFIDTEARVLYTVELTRAFVSGNTIPATTIRLEGSNNTTTGFDGSWTILEEFINIDWSNGTTLTMVPTTQTAYAAYRLSCPGTQVLGLAKAEFKAF